MPPGRPDDGVGETQREVWTACGHSLAGRIGSRSGEIAAQSPRLPLPPQPEREFVRAGTNSRVGLPAGTSGRAVQIHASVLSMLRVLRVSVVHFP